MKLKAGRPVLEVRPVLIPDYLDSTDILLRDGRNEVKPSLTGRWGERLSVGVAGELRQALAKRLQDAVVEQEGSGIPPTRTILVNVNSLDIWPDRRCVLTASWTLLGQDKHALAGGEQGSFVTVVPGKIKPFADSDVVTAMSEAVRQLADRIALSVSRSLNTSGQTATGRAPRT